MSGGGYCHFNEGKGDERLFQIHLCGRDISLRQNPSTHEIGHGAVVWDASVIFAKYVENNPTDFDPSKLKGKRVLELGSGCGLAGITLMMKGCAVTFTDMEKVIVALTDRNVNNIFTQLKLEDDSKYICPRILPLDWTEPEPIPVLLEEVYDYILLTDCVFSCELVEALIKVISTYMNSKTTIICCHEIRDEITNSLFLQKLSEICRLKKIPKSKMNEDYTNPFVELVTAKPIRERK